MSWNCPVALAVVPSSMRLNPLTIAPVVGPAHVAVGGQLAEEATVQVVERSGMRSRAWMPLASAAPFPTVRVTFPFWSAPAPTPGVVLQGFAAGSSAVP